jgi:hypothetical protein
MIAELKMYHTEPVDSQQVHPKKQSEGKQIAPASPPTRTPPCSEAAEGAQKEAQQWSVHLWQVVFIF